MMYNADSTEKKLKVAIYMRVSTDEQASDDCFGLPNQRSKIDALLNARIESMEYAGDGYLYVDEGVSGADEVYLRPAMQRMFDDIEFAPEGKKPFDVVMVYKVDRLARKLSVLLDITERLSLNRIGFASCTEALDTSTPFGNAMLAILGVFAELERSMILERTSGGRNEKVKKGGFMQHKYGYMRDEKKMPYIFEEEASVVRMIFEMFVYQNHTVTEIRKHLSENKIPIPTESRNINKSNKNNRQYRDGYNRGDKKIRQILEDEAYIGEYYFNKTKTTKDKKTGKTSTSKVDKEKQLKSIVKHDPIVDNEIFNRAQEKLGKSVSQGRKMSDSDYILSGLLCCKHCELYRLRGEASHRKGCTSKGTKKQYICSGKGSQKFAYHICNTMPLPKDELEEFIVDNVKKMFVDANVFKEYVMKRKESGIDGNRIKEQISKCTRTINERILGKERTEKSYYEGSISDEKYKEQLKGADEAIIKAENEIVSLKMKLKKETDIDRYAKGIDIFRQLIDTHLDKIFEDRVLLRRFLHYVISRIDIYSKDLPKGTKMPGAPKKGSDGIQAKARKITVRMRLPQEILTSLFEEIKNNGVYATIIE